MHSRRWGSDEHVGHILSERSILIFIAAIVMFAACRPRPALQTITFGAAGPPTLVLLHGYGSSAEEWVPFTQTIQLPSSGRFVFPQAPESIGANRSPGAARAWWPLDLASHRTSAGGLPDLTRARPPGLATATSVVGELLEDLEKDSRGPIIVGGFSQGAMVAGEIAFRSSARIEALVFLSGTPVDEASWESGFVHRRGMPVFVSHGRNDPVLSFALADTFQSKLRTAGLNVTWVPFDGGHEMPARVIAELNRFLKALELVR
jgi:phospholipase/carboxylesterase